MYADDNDDKMLYTTPGSGQIGNPAGGFWPGPHNDAGRFIEVNSRMSKLEAQRNVENGLRMGALWQYVTAAGAYHCPGDLRSRNLRPGSGWAWDSYSKANRYNHNVKGVHSQSGDRSQPLNRILRKPTAPFSARQSPLGNASVS